MLVGLPCSGKSTKAKEFAKEYDATIFSSDELRAELFGDINEQSRNNELFTELHKRIKDCLVSGKSAIYDACNHHYKERMAFLQQLKNIPCEKRCVVMATPYEECIRRSKVRDRKVPEYVIKRMYMAFDIPWYFEGWDKIWIEYPDNFKFTKTAFDWFEDVMDYNQDNPHHVLTLGEHCLQARRYIDNLYAEGNLDYSTDLRYAALLHDVGKPKTKTFTNSKGEVTNVAHYYNHERVGCYESLFYEKAATDLYIATLIRWHMQPYFWEKDNNEKLHNKYRKLWGEKMYKDIMYIHEADKAAH